MTQDPGSGAQMSERMQSLLSRAVEDQLSEQRQLASALADLRAQLAQVGAQLDTLHGASGSPPHLEEALGAIAGHVREAVRLLGERLDGVARLVQERGHDLAEQRAILGELKAAVDRHTNALDGMTSGLAALPAFGERIDALQGGLGGLSERLQGLEELTSTVGALQQRSDALDAGLRELRQAFTGVASRAAQLPGREDLEAMASRVTESVEGLGGRLSRVETSVPSLLERLDALAEAHDSTASTLRDIQDRLGAQPVAPTGAVGGAELVGLQDEVAALREQLATGESRDDLAAVAERLDAVHDGLFGTDGIADRLRALETTEVEPPSAVDPDAVEAAVAKAVAESERRLSDHIDEAVLTLAEALLRRRGRPRPAGLGAVLGATEVESAAAGADAVDAFTTPADLLVADTEDDNAGIEVDDEEYDDPADEADPEDEDEDEDADDADDADDDAPASLFGRPVGTPWQTPSPGDPDPSGEAAEPVADAPREAGKKRKPWWRPGG